MKFKKEDLQNVVYEDCSDDFEKIEDDVIDSSRWSIQHRMIFKFKDKYYRSYYSVGATEMQCEEPYEYDGAEIECEEVHKVEKLVKVWESVA